MKNQLGGRNLRRAYCGLKYGFPSDLNLILKTSYSMKELIKIIENLKKPSELSFDIVRIHPTNSSLLIYSGILVKQLNICPVDMYEEGRSVSEEYKRFFTQWLNSKGKVTEKKSNTEMKRALKTRRMTNG